MPKNTHGLTPSTIRAGVLALLGASIGIVAYLTYRDVLTYGFTATDTLTLIATSRINTIQDALELLTKPLMAGSGFVEFAQFYRPVASFSYGLDYSRWGLNPLGYHLTDVALHATASVLVFATMIVITRGRRVASWLGALVFTSHPILVETVPAIARRHDTIALIFMLVCLSLFALRYWTGTKRGYVMLGASIVAYVLALGAKETAILLPIMVAAYAALFSPQPDEDRARPMAILARVMRACSPYLIVTFLYLCLRAQILGGIGGYSIPGIGGLSNSAATSNATLLTWATVTRLYLQDLILPVVPFMMRAEDMDRARSLFPIVSGIGLVCLLGGCILIFRSRVIRRIVVGSPGARVAAYLAFCALLPLALSLLTMTFSHRLMYIPAAFFCATLAIILTESAKAVFSAPPNWSKREFRSWVGPVQTCVAVPSAILMAYLVFFSPLFADYGEWRASASVMSALLRELSDATPSFSAGAKLHFHDLPRGISTYQKAIPRAKSAGYLTGHSIKSWLDMTAPENRVEITVESYSLVPHYPISLTFDIKSEPGDVVNIFVRQSGQ